MEEKRLGCVEQWGMSCRYSWGCQTRVAGSDRVNGRDMVRQGYNGPHVTATAVRRPSFLNAPINFLKTLHVSGIFSVHHQGFSTVHSALVSFVQVFDDRFQAELRLSKFILL